MAWAPDYCTVSTLSGFMRIHDDFDTAVLTRVVTAASRAVDRATGRQFGVVSIAEARYYPAEWDKATCRWVCSIDDTFATPTAVAVDPNDDATFTGDVGSAFVLTPRNAAAKGQPWTRLEVLASSTYQPEGRERLVRVTAVWGWTTVPATVVQATLLQASRFAVRRDSPYGIAGISEQTPLRLLAKVDPDVQAMLRPYRRSWWVK